MTTATPRERVLRALDALLPYLHRYVNQTLDASRCHGERVDADIGPLAHAMKNEWRTVFAARLDSQVRNYVHELLDIRNRLAHSRSFDDDEARRACDTIRLVAKAVGAPLAQFDGLAAVGARKRATPTTGDSDAISPAMDRAGKRPSQRDVMRAIWSRCAPDEERAIREYAAAERRGEVSRKQNTSALTAEQYASALLADGLNKGWLLDVRGASSERN